MDNCKHFFHFNKIIDMQTIKAEIPFFRTPVYEK